VIALWVLAMIAGFALMVLGSQRAVAGARELAAGTRLPPMFIGVTFLAVGTDLPEIANSIAASLGGHGDVNVGDSLGSAATQATLVAGLLPWVAGPLVPEPRGVRRIGAATVVALGCGAVLLADGTLGRLDALLLVSAWAGISVWLYRASILEAGPGPPAAPTRRAPAAVRTAVALAVVAGAAVVALNGLIRVAEALGVPEFTVSFFAASIGTSLPELVFDATAIRRGQVQMAVGDVLGSSMVDATLSLGIGPLLAPTLIDADLAVIGAITAAAALAVATLVLSSGRPHDRRTGSVLIVVYLAFYGLFLTR